MKHEKVIVIKNLFDPLEFDRDPGGRQNHFRRLQAKSFTNFHEEKSLHTNNKHPPTNKC